MKYLRSADFSGILYTPAVLVLASFFEPTLLPWESSMMVACVSHKAVNTTPTLRRGLK